jgi:3-methyladenine DNA glycosylase AlkD
MEISSGFLLRIILEHNLKNQNPQIVDKYKRYFKEGYDAYGVSQEQNEEFIKFLSDNYDISIDLINSIASKLLLTGKYEDTSIPMLLLINRKKEFTKDTFQIISDWYDIGIDNWAHNDFCCWKLIEIFIKKKLITYNDFDKWRFSERKFKRRAVPVSFIKMLKDFGDYKILFDYIEPIMLDKERVVHQGIGWFLRECWKKQPEITEEFLLKWKNTAPRLIIQYATEKMDKEYRLKFRKDK